jgi:hypothetical protein
MATAATAAAHSSKTKFFKVTSLTNPKTNNEGIKPGKGSIQHSNISAVYNAYTPDFMITPEYTDFCNL